MDVMTPGYWEHRAARFASKGAGLAAVCSYGMPAFYNAYIDVCQRRALEPWLVAPSGAEVLDIGCGVGRWSRYLAARGARVTGVDLSHNMLAEARRRTAEEGLSGRCEYRQADLAEFPVDRQYSLILVVTVLQHILDEDRLNEAVRRLSASLRRGGRIVLMEAAPTRPSARCDTGVFTARTLGQYLEVFRRWGLIPEAVSGVDPMPLKTLFLPYYRRLPKPLALLALAFITALSLPADLVLAGCLTHRSWHKVLVLRHSSGG